MDPEELVLWLGVQTQAAPVLEGCGMDFFRKISYSTVVEKKKANGLVSNGRTNGPSGTLPTRVQILVLAPFLRFILGFSALCIKW
jgi:hypothetical protein